MERTGTLKRRTSVKAGRGKSRKAGRRASLFHHPQLPHFFDRQPAQLFPDDGAVLDDPALLTLKADMRRVTSVFLHFGHSTSASREVTSSSNFFLHVLQRNS
jgi:hypothetical protein